MVLNPTYTVNTYDDLLLLTPTAYETARVVCGESYYEYDGTNWNATYTIAVHSSSIRVADSEVLDEANVLVHSTSARIAESEVLDESNVLLHSTSAGTKASDSKGSASLFHGIE